MLVTEYLLVIFCFQLWRGSENTKKTKRLNEEEIKEQLIDPLVKNHTTKTEELKERSEKVEKLQDAAEIIKEYEEILRMKKKGIISIAYHQGKVFIWFSEREKFVRLVANFKIHKNTIIFKINVFKLIDKHPKLMKSSVTLSFLKNYFKDIKRICQENSSEFEQVKIICLRKLL